MDLEKHISKPNIVTYEYSGLVRIGENPPSDYHTTLDGKQYYKDTYGTFNYYKLVLKRNFNRIKHFFKR